MATDPVSSRKHYCRCYPRSAAVRIPTEWYCFVHRRHVCDNCVYDESDNRHVNCVVGKYTDYLRQAKYEWPPLCKLCSNIITDDPFKAVRLMCKCVFHSDCLRRYMVENFQSNAGITCPKCNTNVTLGTNGPSKLARSVKKFLKLVSRDRIFQKSSRRNSAASSAASKSGSVSSTMDSSSLVNVKGSLSSTHSSTVNSSVESSPRLQPSAKVVSPHSGSHASSSIGIDIRDTHNRDALERESLMPTTMTVDGGSTQRRRHVAQRRYSDSQAGAGAGAAVAYASAQKAQSVRVGVRSGMNDGRTSQNHGFAIFLALFLTTNLVMAYLLFSGRPTEYPPSSAVGVTGGAGSIPSDDHQPLNGVGSSSSSHKKLGIKFLDE